MKAFRSLQNYRLEEYFGTKSATKNSVYSLKISSLSLLKQELDVIN